MQSEVLIHKRCDIDFINNLFKNVYNNKGLDIYLHGSWADNSNISFSDIDDLIIIDDKILDSFEINLIKKHLLDIELDFQKNDPLQHHGHWIILESQLKHYDNSFFPIYLLNDALLIKGREKIEYNIAKGKTKQGLLNNVRYTCRQIELYYSKLKRNKLNIYELKCFIGSILLLPAYIFQLQGKQISKKDSILLSKNIFGNYAYELINWASEIRRNWNKVTNSDEFLRFSLTLNSYTESSLWRLFAKENAPVVLIPEISDFKITDQMITHFLDECVTYIEKFSYFKYSKDDYIKAYKEIEVQAIKTGALAVGKFGSISCPSISDLDVLICYNETDAKSHLEELNDYIDNSEFLSYLFVHKPLYITPEMIPYLNTVHTLENLEITFSSDNRINSNIIKFENQTNKYILKNIWNFYLLGVCRNTFREIKYLNTRFLLLLIKNIHTSLDNLNINQNYSSRSVELRNRIIEIGNSAYRKEIENEFFIAFNELEACLSSTNSVKRRGKRFINNRLLIVESKINRMLIFKGNFIVYVNTSYFNFFVKLYEGRNKHFYNFAKAHTILRRISDKYHIVPYQFVLPFPYLIPNVNTSIKQKVKRVIMNIYLLNK